MNMTKFFRAAIVTSALFAGLVASAKADIRTWAGTTTGGPTFDISQIGAIGTAVPYAAFGFTVDTDGVYTFQQTSQWDIDSVGLLYESSFNPNDLETNLIAAEDDSLTINTSAFPIELTAGTTYVYVVAGFTNTDFGQYSVTVGGPGLITAVPEPSTYLMLGLGLAAIGYTARRKAQR